ncbi:hypothetical protein SDC9_151184 [bioreactor metagenome]|uniref:Protein-export protein SecB n=1 Tax=bioreactor metagenome TaxID=1076179 RepID=A0A645ERZ6_9ZZZZ
MGALVQKGYTIRSLNFENHINGKATLEITATVSSKVEFNDKTSECVCFFTVMITNKGDELLLKILMKMDAVFSYDQTEDKKELHTKISRELYPQVRTVISAFSGSIGLPPIMVPPLEFNAESVDLENKDKAVE